MNKTADVGAAEFGDIITYSISYQNVGNGPTTQTILVDSPAECTEYVLETASGGGSYDPALNLITWEIGRLEPGQGGVVTYQARVTCELTTGEFIQGEAVLDSLETDPVSDVAIVAYNRIKIKKQVNKSEAAPGNVLTYTLNYGNAGRAPMLGAVITDQLPYRTEFILESNIDAAYEGLSQTLTWSPGTLRPQDQGSLSYQVLVKEDVPNNELIVNDAIIQSQTTLPQRSNEARTIIRYPGIEISKGVSPRGAYIADVVDYTVTIRNTRAGDAFSCVLEDAMTPGLAYEPGTTFIQIGEDELTEFGDSQGENPYCWNLGAIKGFSTVTLTYKVLVTAEAPEGVDTNTVTIIGKDISDNTIYNRATTDLLVIKPKLTIKKSASRPSARLGDLVTYTIEVNNISAREIREVEVVDEVPPGFTVLRETMEPKPANEKNPFIWKLGDLAANSQKTITYQVVIGTNAVAGLAVCRSEMENPNVHGILL
ncbi:MAG: hypothetical protein QME81_07035 [bacterium]|nr:hypothetical protein [bacterium]